MSDELEDVLIDELADSDHEVKIDGGDDVGDGDDDVDGPLAEHELDLPNKTNGDIHTMIDKAIRSLIEPPGF